MELFIVSICLWCITDFLYFRTDLSFQPLGYDVEHTYQLTIEEVPSGSLAFIEVESEVKNRIGNPMKVIDRLRAYPGVEAVSISQNSRFYSYNSSSGSQGIDTTWVHGNMRYVSPDFFRVFRVTDKEGRIEPLVEAARQENTFIVSAATEREFAKKTIKTLGSPIKIWGQTEAHNTVRAISADLRVNDFQPVYPEYFVCLQDIQFFRRYGTNVEICFRLTPEADVPGFITKFRQQMKTQLHVGNIYMLDLVSIEDTRDGYLSLAGESTHKMLAAIAFFLLINIFLGIIGTFWVRTEQRRSEIGLRLALGSSRSKLKRLLVAEGLLIMSFVIVPSLIICYNIGRSILDSFLDFSMNDFIVSSLITYALIALMIVLGVYIPSRQATKIEPAEALREE